MINLDRHLKAKGMKRSARSYLVNGAMRAFVRTRFKKEATPAPEMRAFLLDNIEPRAKFSPGVNITEDVIDDIPVQWIKRENHSSENLLIYLHGGAFIMETPRTHGAFISRLMEKCDVTALMPAYRLAPEHPFPAAVDDCLKIYRWVLDSGFDPAKVILAGDSAGGNLTLVTLQQAKAAGWPMPACAFMISPGTDFTGTDSQRDNAAKDPMFNEHALAHVIKYYLNDEKQLTQDPRVSPLKGEFDGLPPLFFMAGSTELFRDCSVLAAQKAMDAGVEVSCQIWRAMPHVFPIMFADVMPEALVATDDITDFINRRV